MKAKTRPVTVRLPEATIEHLRDLAEREHRSQGQMMTVLIERAWSGAAEPSAAS